jgi:signal transduction histidine kinase
MAKMFKDNKISRDGFKEYIIETNQSAQLVLKNLERTAKLVQGFKQVSVDQSSELKRTFNVKEYTEDIFSSMNHEMEKMNVHYNLDIEDDLEINSYPGAYTQIITNLIMNSLIHGFEKKQDGEIQLSIKLDNGNMDMIYSDDGEGIAPSELEKIFEPFYTGDRKKGIGLGLHIVYNLVTQKLKGSVSCNSNLEKGVQFNLIIPVKLD